ncbi:MAG: hypothetical protein ACRDS0_26555 [Pseudonocardiaceae bacterium]
MSNLSTPHTTWCDQESCYTDHNGKPIHRSEGRPFDLDPARIWTASMLWVQLADVGNGIEIGLSIEGAITRVQTTMLPEDAAELGDCLLDHAERAMGLSRLAE